MRMGSGHLYRSPNIVRVIKTRRLRRAGHAARMEEGRNDFKILTGIPAGKRPFRTPRGLPLNSGETVDGVNKINLNLKFELNLFFFFG